MVERAGDHGRHVVFPRANSQTLPKACQLTRFKQFVATCMEFNGGFKLSEGLRQAGVSDVVFYAPEGYKQSTRAPTEVIVAVELEPPPAGSFWIWRKVGARRAQAISKVALAGVAEVREGRFSRFGAALASVAPVTALMPTLRSLVVGACPSAIDPASVDAAVEADIQPIDDLRSTRAYRMHVATALVRGFLRELGAPT